MRISQFLIASCGLCLMLASSCGVDSITEPTLPTDVSSAAVGDTVESIADATEDAVSEADAEPCEGNCIGRLCGDDGCGGSCGECDGGSTCNAQGQCACSPSCEGKNCGPDGCGGQCGTCEGTQVCGDAGICETAGCTPACEDKVCGADGCGGVCGTCDESQTCAADGSACLGCGTDEVADCNSACAPLAGYGDGVCDPAFDCELLAFDGGDCTGSSVDCPPGDIPNCQGACTTGSWLGDGFCDNVLNCEETGYDGGDCGVPCEAGTTQDCEGGCSSSVLLGDGNCDAIFECAAASFDEGDCAVECDEGKIVNCNFGCTLESWLADDFCDSAFDCEALDFDGGDCCATGTVKDCENENCVAESLLGDGNCDEAFACSAKGFDQGDCEVICDDDEIVNCDNGCTSASWMGDSICDSALACDALNWDDGDCEPCFPSCDGKDCGDDGCGGSCGICAAGLVCSEVQVCSEPAAGSTCADPLQIGALPFSTVGNTSYSSSDFSIGAGACPGTTVELGTASNDQVYEFTPNVTGVYTVNVTAEFDSLTYVTSSCADISSTCLGADDAVGSAVETVIFSGQAGQSYYIFVDGWSNYSNLNGSYTLDVSEPCLPSCSGKVCGDDGCGFSCGECEEGFSCDDTGQCLDNALIPGSTCNNPYVIGALPFSGGGNTTYASNDFSVPTGGPCEGTSSTLGLASRDHVWQFDIVTSGVYTVELDAEFDSALYAMRECQDVGSSCLGATDTTGAEELSIEATAGETIWIVVDGWSPSSDLFGEYTLDVGEPCVPSCEGKACGSDGCGGTCGVCDAGQGCGPDSTCMPVEDLPGDTCDNPVLLTTAPMLVSGETLNATNTFGFGGSTCPGVTSSRGLASADRVHVFTAPTTGVYTFELDADFDTTLYVASSCEAVDTSCLGADDTVGKPEKVLVTLTAGETVYVYVDGWSNYSNVVGSYALSVGEPCTPQCDGKGCGEDGCGYVCGTCEAGYICDDTSNCRADDAITGNVCLNPLQITEAPYSVQGTTQGFSPNYNYGTGECTGEASGYGDASSDVTYRFVAPVAGVFTFGLQASFDSTLYVVRDCTDISETCLGASDNGSGTLEEVSVSLAQGDAVFVIVDGYSNYTNLDGTYTLTVSEPCIQSCAGKQCGDDGCGATCGVCASDELCDAANLCIAASAIPGNVCANPFTVGALPASMSGNTANGSANFSIGDGACEGAPYSKGGASNDHVYAFTPPGSGVYTISLDSEFDAALYAFTNCDDVDGSCVAGADSAISGDEVITLTAVAGSPHFIVVDGWSNSSNLQGAYTLNVSDVCTPDCSGKQCGDDGCGGTCGACLEYQDCSADGQCLGCEPDCNGKQCGPDGCGGTCGSCDTGLGCTSSGECSEAASCVGKCGGAATGCYCDVTCFDTGDCCDDICTFCGDLGGAQCN